MTYSTTEPARRLSMHVTKHIFDTCCKPNVMAAASYYNPTELQDHFVYCLLRAKPCQCHGLSKCRTAGGTSPRTAS